MLRFLKNHKKKLIAGGLVLLFGCKYSHYKYNERLLLRNYCQAAEVFGDQLLHIHEEPKQLYVFLDRGTDKYASATHHYFTKYLSPLLNLAGVKVDLINIYDGDFNYQLEENKYFQNLLKNLEQQHLVASNNNKLSLISAFFQSFNKNTLITTPVNTDRPHANNTILVLGNYKNYLNLINYILCKCKIGDKSIYSQNDLSKYLDFCWLDFGVADYKIFKTRWSSYVPIVQKSTKSNQINLHSNFGPEDQNLPKNLLGSVKYYINWLIEKNLQSLIALRQICQLTLYLSSNSDSHFNKMTQNIYATNTTTFFQHISDVFCVKFNSSTDSDLHICALNNIGLSQSINKKYNFWTHYFPFSDTISKSIPSYVKLVIHKINGNVHPSQFETEKNIENNRSLWTSIGYYTGLNYIYNKTDSPKETKFEEKQSNNYQNSTGNLILDKEILGHVSITNASNLNRCSFTDSSIYHGSPQITIANTTFQNHENMKEKDEYRDIINQSTNTHCHVSSIDLEIESSGDHSNLSDESKITPAINITFDSATSDILPFPMANDSLENINYNENINDENMNNYENLSNRAQNKYKTLKIHIDVVPECISIIEFNSL